MKAFRRLDARPDDLETIAKQKLAEAEEYKRLAKIEYDRTHTPKYLKKAAEAKILREKKDKEDIEKWHRKMDMEQKTRMIDDPAGPFVYYDRVRVTKPLPDGGCNKGQIAYLDREGFIECQNSCKCGHSVSKNCYYALLDGDKSATHFEECEIEKVDKSGKEYCIQCISDRGPLHGWDGLCECEKLNKGEQNEE